MKHGTDHFPFAVYEDRYYCSSYPWHWHDEIEIGYARKGRVLVEINQEPYVIKEGNGIFINSGILHALAGVGNQEAIFLNVLFQRALVYGSTESVFYERYLSRLLKGLNLSSLLLDREVDWQRSVSELLEDSISEEEKKEWGYEFRIRGKLTEIVLLILKHCHGDSEETSGNQKNGIRIRCMVDYIRKHYAEDIRLGDIAAVAAIGERECLRCFQDFMKKSPKQYVIEIRICNAKRLLASTTLSIREIGELCGFRDASYFSKAFRDYSGVSPREYQRSVGKDQDMG